MKPKEYASCNMLQRSNVLNLIDEFEEELIQISGKCMDVGCGPGDIMKDILLPALNPNAIILGKIIIPIEQCYNNIYSNYYIFKLLFNLIITYFEGIDISKDMIEFAKKTYKSNERLKFEVLDIQTKSLPKKYISGFDHIFSFFTLHWCYDIR